MECNLKIRPPQFVFDIVAAKAVHDFINEEALAREVVAQIVASLSPMFDTTDLNEDLLEAIRRFLLFMSARKISNLPLFLMSFIWYRTNFKNLHVRRAKTTIFQETDGDGHPLLSMGSKPVNDFSRVSEADKAFKDYAEAVHKGRMPVRPRDWKPSDEAAFSPLIALLFPTPPDEDISVRHKERLPDNRPRHSAITLSRASITPRGGFKSRQPAS